MTLPKEQAMPALLASVCRWWHRRWPALQGVEAHGAGGPPSSLFAEFRCLFFLSLVGV